MDEASTSPRVSDHSTPSPRRDKQGLSRKILLAAPFLFVLALVTVTYALLINAGDFDSNNDYEPVLEQVRSENLRLKRELSHLQKTKSIVDQPSNYATGGSRFQQEEPLPPASNLRVVADTVKTKSPKVLYTVFAGRKDRLLLQEPYWREMIRIGAIHEVHLWNFTNKEVDLEYMRHVSKKYSSFLKIMEPSDVPLPETYWHDSNTTLRDVKNDLGRGRGRFDWPARYVREAGASPFCGKHVF